MDIDRHRIADMHHAPDLPEGQAIECPTPPALTQAHTARLRKLWSYGRPVHVGNLGGMDLDLLILGLVQTVDDTRSCSAVLTVTKAGVVHLNEVRQAQIAAQRPHHELGHRLARHLQSKGLHTWENLEFANPHPTPDATWSVVRPDVFACLPALRAANAEPAIYEVKVQRADFLSDLARPQKRQAYSALAQAVYYCCPHGLIDKTEIPDGFGLLVEVSTGLFELKKKARRQKNFVLSANTAMTLMVKRQMPLGLPGEDLPAAA